MPITNEELQRLLSFVGYGTTAAPVWFLGMEEGQSRETDPEDDLRLRSTMNPVVDIYEAHKLIGGSDHFSGKRKLQPTWRRMCELMLRLEHGIYHPNATNTEMKRAYQATRLGRSNGETLLLELMPIAKPDAGHWHGSNVLPQYSSKEDYYAQEFPARAEMLRKLISDHRPGVVIAYGKAYWPQYQSLFQDLEIVDVEGAVGNLQVGRGNVPVIFTAHLTRNMYDRHAIRIAELAKSFLDSR